MYVVVINALFVISCITKFDCYANFGRNWYNVEVVYVPLLIIVAFIIFLARLSLYSVELSINKQLEQHLLQFAFDRSTHRTQFHKHKLSLFV